MLEFINQLIANFGNFFSMDVIWTTLSDPVSWGIIGTLIILEGLLSADNALVLAIMVKHLPKEQQKKALFYGILGAYLFRFIAIGVGTYLVSFLFVKIIGALYLLFIAYKGLIDKGSTAFSAILIAVSIYFIPFWQMQVVAGFLLAYVIYSGIKKSHDEDNEVKGTNYGFWKTVLMVELMDIAFSIDSVVAAFGVSEQVWVLYLGGILGVLMMRGVAQVFLKLINYIPELEKTAFILVALIGVKMLVVAGGIHVSHLLFFGTIVGVFGGAIVIGLMNRRKEERQLS